MHRASERFHETVTGSHLAVVRVRLCETVQFGSNPVGEDIPLLGGDVRQSSTTDIKGTVQATIPGDYWDAIQPYGTELFVERGVDFGDGTREMIPIGYYRISKVSQETQPYGPVRVDGTDRTGTLQQVRVIYPYQVTADTTHRTIMNYLVNGIDSGSGTYGMCLRNPIIPIDWTEAGYDPDAVTVGADVVVDDYVYDFLAKLVDTRDAVIRFLPTGELAIQRREPDPEALAEHAIKVGVNGTLIRASRSVTREGVYNMVRAVGSDPAYQTGWALAYNNDSSSPLYWAGKFGPSVRYYPSPLLRTFEQAQAAAETVLARSTGLPMETSVYAVPDPTLQPLDKINVTVAGVTTTHIIDEITIPLVGADPLVIKTRTVNPVGVIEPGPSQPPPTDPEDPEDPPGEDPGGGGDPGPGPGPADPADGTQVAVLQAWGPVIDGDEFNYTGAPNPAKWGLYNGPGHVGNGLRRSSAYNVANGVCTCTGDASGTTGGMAFRRGEMGYRVEVRMRCYNIASGNDRYHPVLILWPDSDQWPQGAEYDFAEADEGTGVMHAFMHLPNHQPYRQDHVSRSLDIQNWHNYACEWNPTARTLKAWIDGELFYSGSGRVAEAPGPMHLTSQLDHFGGNPRPARMEMAWVRIYQRPNG